MDWYHHEEALLSRLCKSADGKDGEVSEKLIAGIDEAGRGPLAGPVYAAAVILPFRCEILGLNDSKKITELRREKLFDVICEKSISYGIGVATVHEIDELNILQATLLAMQRAYEALDLRPDWVLVDGNSMPKLPVPCETIVRGDTLSANIAAASIIAKVSRDRLMREYGEAFPEYGFERHKGYGTVAHYEAIKEHGILEIHRKTFLKNLSSK